MIYTRICKVCAAEFETDKRAKKYCDYCSRDRMSREHLHPHQAGENNLSRIGSGFTRASYGNRLRFGFELMNADGGKYGGAEDE
jgi:hypothetical protein